MKIIIFIVLFIEILFSKTIVAHYSISYGIFDEIAKAKAIFSMDKNSSFYIKMEAKADGFIGKFSTRVESYESLGVMRDGILIPKKFVNYKKDGSKIVEKIYLFDHTNQKIKQIENNKKNNKILDIKESNLNFYAKNDILTLFFNLKNLKITKDNFKLYAVGGNKKDGHIDVNRPDDKQKKELNSLFLEKENGDFLIVTLYRKIFSSNKGELLIKLDDDSLCKEAILKDVLFYGDIKGKLTKKEIF